ncbi:D-alanyl-D-alanine carboxypeptidase (penicillin-binding protein 5/6) [Microbacterium sp. ru370.1]|uniref:D-alanyl-D-alanine carboxypeptidase family protein n=1 Tax=unclassified Microbacterium TaxID=2609290 RepID=UPI00088C89A1|nr:MULTISPECIES: D-alanyl-D-alanine carboxypeptidase [unclassified Microbacterium]SDO29046.1 D-alanyl-D-alanine carboxypeptidase (penicillin-binding protein 5/6) [Microbacterium sp. ru370.1]SIT75432.1 D-alanyl-D-alanine carboxypeptidase (penicillin-binding protein 5/6) [Microbacterium sp. RU1D]
MHEQIPATRRAPRDPAEASLENTTDAEMSAPDEDGAGAGAGGAVTAPAGTASGTGAPSSAPAPGSGDAPSAPRPGADAPASTPAPTGALAWVDPGEASAPRPSPTFIVSGTTSRQADLLSGARRRRLRPATVIPPVLLVLILAAYVATTLLWPLNAVRPTTRAVALQPASAPAAQPAWPAEGEAAIAIDGVPGTLSSSASAPESIASITKVVTALVVLDRLPLAPGEQGKSYAFTQADSADYWQYRARGESSLDVPVDGSLTQLQMLQGMLIASANNYAQRLASDLFGTDAAFSAAANAYLAERGIEGITIVNPTGIEAGNTATPAALIALAERALANPVIAEIVRTPELTLPGAGTFRNGNALLGDPGVVGVKTGTLDAWNLLTAKDITVGGATVRAYAAVLGQPGPDTRNEATRDLFTQLEEELQPSPSVTAGTVVGKVETLWSDDIDLVSASDATVVLWNGATAQTSTRFDLGDAREPGETVGTLTATGPVDAATVDVQLADEIEPPSPWWRLTHPLDLFGVNN